MRGRYPSGPEVAAQCQGSPQARWRWQVILKVNAGELRVAEACKILGIGPTQLDKLRRRAMQAAVDALEPRAAGRPRRRPEPQAERIAELEARIAELEKELTLSRAREEIAGIHTPPAKKKKKVRR